MSVQINEPGANNQPSAINLARFAADLKAAHGDDTVPASGQIALLTGLSAAVINHGAADDKVGLNGSLVSGNQSP